MTIVEIKPEVQRNPAETIDAPPPGPAQAAPAGVKTAQSGLRDRCRRARRRRRSYRLRLFQAAPIRDLPARKPPQVVVAYADEELVADQQIAEISGLLPLRERLLRLMEDLPSKMQEHHRAQLATRSGSGWKSRSRARKPCSPRRSTRLSRRKAAGVAWPICSGPAWRSLLRSS